MIIHPIFLVPIITGPVFLVGGFILLKYPPKKINWWYGYRTARSMRSQESWDFSQIIAGREMIKAGSLLFILSLPGWLMKFNINKGAEVILGVAILVIFALVPIIRTERALRKQFPEL